MNSTENRRGRNSSTSDCTNLANTSLVAESDQTYHGQLLFTSKNIKRSEINAQTKPETPTDKNAVSGFSYIRTALRKQGISRTAEDLILKSWRTSTQKQYNTYINRWLHFCEGKRNPFKTTAQTVTEFLVSQYQNGLSYTAINTARSAISNFVRLTGNINIHENEIISRFMKGVFNEKPSLPRYTVTWDVHSVLHYLETMDTSTLLLLSEKLCMLFLLVTGQRCQTLHLINATDIETLEDRIIVHITDILKHSRPGFHLKPITLHRYDENDKICIVTTLKEYMERTQHLRNGSKLLISTVKPHNSVSKQTISRWVKSIMSKAGIPDIFKPHSTRSASMSRAYYKGVPLKEVIKSAGWSNAKTFAKYYKRPIIHNTEDMQCKILRSVTDTNKETID